MKISKILCCTAALGLAACLGQNATAQTATAWEDTTGDGLWSTAANWSSGIPNSATPSVNIDLPAGPCTIPSSYAADAGSVALSMTFGPEWGETFNLAPNSSLVLGWAIAPVQNWPNYGLRSTINMHDGSVMSIPSTGAALALGCNWWWTGGPYVTMNMYGSSQFNAPAGCGTWFGGHLNIYDTASCLINGYVNIEVNDGAQIDLNDSMNICGGTLLLPEGWATGSGAYNGTSTGSTTDLINRGILRAYGKALDSADLVISDNGTDTIITTVPLGGSLTGIRFEALNEAAAPVGSQQSLLLVGDYPSVTGVLLSSPEPGIDLATLPGTPAYTSSDSCVVTVDANGVATAVGPGNAIITATVGSFTATMPFNVPQKATPIHRYSFTAGSGTTVADSITLDSAYEATLIGGATLGGGQVTLDGSTGYVQLPAGILTGAHDVTIETWASFGSPINTWAGLFAFGYADNFGDANNGYGGDYISFQPHTGGGGTQAGFAQGIPGNGDEMDAVWATPLDGMTGAHVVAVYAPSTSSMSIYVNGVLATSMPADFAHQLYNSLIDPGAFAANGSILDYTLNTRAIADEGVNESIADPDNFIGRDCYGDPYLNGSIAEFRIYNTALSASQVSADYALGPTTLIGSSTAPVTLTVTQSAGNIVISWPTNSAYVTLASSTSFPVTDCWTAVSNGTWTVVGGNYVVTIPASSAAQYFILQ
ncbi:MAG: LamG-like jellyroll fold domain-containing protein [Limisphaerales bacterium]